MGDASGSGQRRLIGLLSADGTVAAAVSAALTTRGWLVVSTASHQWLELTRPGSPMSDATVSLVVIVDGSGRVPEVATDVATGRHATSVVILGRRQNFAALADAVIQNAAMVVDIDQPFYDLLDALVEVLDGTADLPDPAALASILQRRAAEERRFMTLSRAERRVLGALVSGSTPARIAAVETVELTTVRSHIRNIFTKIGVQSQVEAVAMARRSCTERSILAEIRRHDHQ